MDMRIKYIFCFLFIFIGTYAFATFQTPDRLIYNGRRYLLYNPHFENEYPMGGSPMENYFYRFPEKRPKKWDTGLYRGYIATFEIIENELWVIDIQTRSSESIIEECLDGKSKMKIDWYNGLLLLPIYGFYSDDYKLLEIENGNFIREIDLLKEHYFIYRDMQDELFKRPHSYLRIINKKKYMGLPSELLDYFKNVYNRRFSK